MRQGEGINIWVSPNQPSLPSSCCVVAVLWRFVSSCCIVIVSCRRRVAPSLLSSEAGATWLSATDVSPADRLAAPQECHMGEAGLPSPFPPFPFPLGGLRGGGHCCLLRLGGCVALCSRVVRMGDLTCTRCQPRMGGRRSWRQVSSEGGRWDERLTTFSSLR